MIKEYITFPFTVSSCGCIVSEANKTFMNARVPISMATKLLGLELGNNSILAPAMYNRQEFMLDFF